MIIRPCSEEDIPLMLEIEQASFPDPWTEGMFRSGFSERGVYYYAAEADMNMLGFIGLCDDCFDCVGISTLAVAERYRRSGTASKLLQTAELKTLELTRPRLTLEVRAGNLPAIRLYEKFGFRNDGICPGYYLRPKEDAVIMSKYYDYSVN
ncbi:MAG: ribosomal protein S18-alanine N-acetyltransferase [Oscillospiraceae bacterium]|jgi:ribosomal-protein-alanine N-acetyltransferase|nr:ribosomal protein S18-alanine N-acetyltransferase [Oscillospiraceae bacterium]